MGVRNSHASWRKAAGLVLFSLLAIRCSESAPPAAPAPVVRPAIAVAIQNLTSGRSSPEGFVYELRLQIRETGGADATVASVRLTFSNSNGVVGATEFEGSAVLPSAIPAGGQATTPLLVSSDNRAGTAFATQVTALVTLVGGVTGAASAEVPELPPTAPPDPDPPAPPTQPAASVDNFTVSRATIRLGEIATLTWVTSNATDVVITNGVGSVPISGSRDVSPVHQSNSYRLIATGAGGSDERSLLILVEDSMTCSAVGLGGATAVCNDGTTSQSQNRSGTCSSHGGVKCWVCPGPLCEG